MLPPPWVEWVAWVEEWASKSGLTQTWYESGIAHAAVPFFCRHAGSPNQATGTPERASEVVPGLNPRDQNLRTVRSPRRPEVS